MEKYSFPLRNSFPVHYNTKSLQVLIPGVGPFIICSVLQKIILGWIIVLLPSGNVCADDKYIIFNHSNFGMLIQSLSFILYLLNYVIIRMPKYFS
jgi:hypothetical protein